MERSRFLDNTSNQVESNAVSKQNPEVGQSCLSTGFLDQASTQCVVIAEAMLRTARVRDQAFGPDFFSDPAWDLLLHLFVNEHKNRNQTTSELSAILSRKPATLSRYLHALEMRGLLVRAGNNDDPALQLPSLTDLGGKMMLQALAAFLLDDPQPTEAP
jgi:DNA-binding MarR family transcriptional regulator